MGDAGGMDPGEDGVAHGSREGEIDSIDLSFVADCQQHSMRIVGVCGKPDVLKMADFIETNSEKNAAYYKMAKAMELVLAWARAERYKGTSLAEAASWDGTTLNFAQFAAHRCGELLLLKEARDYDEQLRGTLGAFKDAVPHIDEAVRRHGCAKQGVQAIYRWATTFAEAVAMALSSIGKHPVKQVLQTSPPILPMAVMERENCGQYDLAGEEGKKCDGPTLECFACDTRRCVEHLEDSSLRHYASKLQIKQALENVIEGHSREAIVYLPVVCVRCQETAGVWPIPEVVQLSAATGVLVGGRTAEELHRLIARVALRPKKEESDLGLWQREFLQQLRVLYDAGPTATTLIQRACRSVLATDVATSMVKAFPPPLQQAEVVFTKHGAKGPYVAAELVEQAARVGIKAIRTVLLNDESKEESTTFGRMAMIAAGDWAAAAELSWPPGTSSGAPAIPTRARGVWLDVNEAKDRAKAGLPPLSRPPDPHKSPNIARYKQLFGKEFQSGFKACKKRKMPAKKDAASYRTLLDYHKGNPGMRTGEMGLQEDDDAEEDIEDQSFDGEEPSEAGSYDAAPRGLAPINGDDEESMGARELAASTPRDRPPKRPRTAPPPQAAQSPTTASPAAARQRLETSQSEDDLTLLDPPPRVETPEEEQADRSQHEQDPPAPAFNPNVLPFFGMAGPEDTEDEEADAEGVEPDDVGIPPDHEGDNPFLPRMSAGMDLQEKNELLAAKEAAWADAPGAVFQAYIDDHGQMGLMTKRKEELAGDWGFASANLPDKDEALPATTQEAPNEEARKTWSASRLAFTTALFDALKADRVPVGGPDLPLARSLYEHALAYNREGGQAYATNADYKSDVRLGRALDEYTGRVLDFRIKVKGHRSTPQPPPQAHPLQTQAPSALRQQRVKKWTFGVLDGSGGAKGWIQWEAEWAASCAGAVGLDYAGKLQMLMEATEGEARDKVVEVFSCLPENPTDELYRSFFLRAWGELESSYGNPEAAFFDATKALRESPPVLQVVDLPGFESLLKLVERVRRAFKSTEKGRKVIQENADREEQERKIDAELEDTRKDLLLHLPPDWAVATSTSSEMDATSGAFYVELKSALANKDTVAPEAFSWAALGKVIDSAKENARKKESRLSYLADRIRDHTHRLRRVSGLGENAGATNVYAMRATSVSSSTTPSRRRRQVPQPAGGGCVLCHSRAHDVGSDSDCPLDWRQARAKAEANGLCRGCSWDRKHLHLAERKCPYTEPCRYCSEGEAHHPRFCQTRNPTGGRLLTLREARARSSSANRNPRRARALSEAASEGESQPPLDPRNIEAIKNQLRESLRRLACEAMVGCEVIERSTANEYLAKATTGGTGGGGAKGNRRNPKKPAKNASAQETHLGRVSVCPATEEHPKGGSPRKEKPSTLKGGRKQKLTGHPKHSATGAAAATGGGRAPASAEPEGENVGQTERGSATGDNPSGSKAKGKGRKQKLAGQPKTGATGATGATGTGQMERGEGATGSEPRGSKTRGEDVDEEKLREGAKGDDPTESSESIAVSAVQHQSHTLKHTSLPTSAAAVMTLRPVLPEGEEREVELNAVLDDGAGLSFISEETVRRLGLRTTEIIEYLEKVPNSPPRRVVRPLHQLLLKRGDGLPGFIALRLAEGDGPMGTESIGGIRLTEEVLRLRHAAKKDVPPPRRTIELHVLAGRDTLSVLAPHVESFDALEGSARRYAGPGGVAWSGGTGGPWRNSVIQVNQISQIKSILSASKHLKAALKANPPPKAPALLPRNPPSAVDVLQDDPGFWTPDQLSDHLASLEVIGLEIPVKCPEDLPLWKAVNDGIQQNPDGRLVVPLPRRADAPPVPKDQGRAMAYRRLAQTMTKSSSEALTICGRDFGELEALNVLKELTSTKGLNLMYVAWFCVKKLDGGWRPVLDCSSRGSGVTYGDLLHAGPALVHRVQDVLLGARLGIVLIVADLAKAFYSLAMKEEDKALFNILLPKQWIKDALKDPPRVMQFQRMVMGSPPSPFILQAAIFYILDRACKEELLSPKEKDRCLAAIYVDDVGLAGESATETMELMLKVQAILKTYCFDLTKVKSTANAAELPLRFLGMMVYEGDVLGLCAPGWAGVKERENTLVKILAWIGIVFDPFGLACPLVLPLRTLFQDVVRRISEEEEKEINSKGCYRRPLLPEETQRMENYVRELESFKDIRLPRNILPPPDSTNRMLWGFSDASGSALGLCVYLMSQHSETKRWTSTFLYARSRVAPAGSKRRTIPSLEGAALDLLSKTTERLQKYLCHVLGFYIPHTRLHTDSTVAWWWVAGPDEPHGLPQQALRSRIRARGHFDIVHVRGPANPADIPSRPIHKGEYFTRPNDFHLGPSWANMDEWPITDQSALKNPDVVRLGNLATAAAEDSDKVRKEVEDENKVRHARPFAASELTEDAKLRVAEIIEKAENFSYWGVYWGPEKEQTGMVHVSSFRSWAALVKHLADRGPEPRNPYADFQAAEVEIMLAIQASVAPDIVKDVLINDKGGAYTRDKCLFVSKEEIKRLGLGVIRTAMGEACLDATKPVWIPSTHRLQAVVRLYLSDAHQQMTVDMDIIRHYDVGTTVSRLLGRVNGKGVKRLAEQEMRRENFCLPCHKASARPFLRPPPGGSRPEQLRLLLPFTACGVDLLGPYSVRGNSKRYALVAVCLSTRALWTTTMPQATTEAVISALVRLESEHRRPARICSDAGSQLHKLGTALRQAQAADGAFSEWHSNASNAPWMGGSWERIIGLLKKSLKRSLNDRKIPVLSEDKLRTFLAVATRVVNERPLCPPSATHAPTRPLDYLVPQSSTPMAEGYDEPKKSVAEVYESTSIADYTKRFSRFFYCEWMGRLVARGGKKGLGVSREPLVGEWCLLRKDGISVPQPVCVVSLRRSRDGLVRSVRVRNPATGQDVDHPPEHLLPYPREDAQANKFIEFNRGKKVHLSGGNKEKMGGGRKMDHGSGADAQDAVSQPVPAPESLVLSETAEKEELPSMDQPSAPSSLKTESVPAQSGEACQPDGELAEAKRPKRAAAGVPRSDWGWNPSAGADKERREKKPPKAVQFSGKVSIWPAEEFAADSGPARLGGGSGLGQEAASIPSEACSDSKRRPRRPDSPRR